MYTKPERIALRNHPDYNEKWVQSIIADDPSVLQLGELVLKDQERRQPSSGRLDLLLQDVDAVRRYEVEIQLGSTDESHIIRTIEYWDIERRRYPQYDHCAVIVAEEVTSRFLNVISLFNGSIPLVAIQMQAFEVGGHVTLLFTTVLDEFSRGLVDDDEDDVSPPADRAYWEGRSSTSTVALAHQLLDLIRQVDDSIELNYVRAYIGLLKQERPFNFVRIHPRKKHLLLDVFLTQSQDWDDKIENANIDTLEYRYGRYRLRINGGTLDSESEVLKELLESAYAQKKGT